MKITDDQRGWGVGRGAFNFELVGLQIRRVAFINPACCTERKVVGGTTLAPEGGNK